jgi:hypothetical protein
MSAGGAGGLVLTGNAHIRMAPEDLSISPKAVRVRYVFVNDSRKDSDITVDPKQTSASRRKFAARRDTHLLVWETPAPQ